MTWILCKVSIHHSVYTNFTENQVIKSFANHPKSMLKKTTLIDNCINGHRLLLMSEKINETYRDWTWQDTFDLARQGIEGGYEW